MRSSRKSDQMIQIKGNPARMPAVQEKPLKNRTSRNKPGISLFLEAPSAIRMPSCLDLCRKKRPAA